MCVFCFQAEYNEGSCPELFAALQLCYQAGVFVSRSSLGLLKIRRVEVLSVLQLINMVIWVLLPVVGVVNIWGSSEMVYNISVPVFFFLQWHFLPTYILPSFMIYVGLLGGELVINIHVHVYHS